MKTSMIPATLLVLALAACSDAPQSAPKAGDPVQARGQAALIQVSASVESVDVEKRLITLKGSEGNTGVYHVGTEVKRLAEIHAGDKIRGDYSIGFVAEFREPTPQEKSDPLVFAEVTHRGPSTNPPQGAISRVLRVVTTIDAIDAGKGTVTVKGPLGGRVTAEVQDKSLIPTVKVGQSIIATFSETLLLTVEPGPKKN
jgi:hypothetical protein